MSDITLPSGTAGASIKEKVKKSDVTKVFITMVLMYIASGIIQPNYFSGSHIMITLVMASFLGIIAIGQTMVILTGGIDMSIAYSMNLGAVVMTAVTVDTNGTVAIFAVLAVGILIGLFNGIGIAYLKITPMVMTLATNSILQSITYVYTNGTPRGTASEFLRYIGTGSIGGIRVAFIFWMALAALIIFILNKSVFGRKVYAVGSNAQTSKLSGINKNLVLVGVYTISGLASVTAGMLMVGYSGFAYLGMGDSYQMASVAAVVIGATSILGGKGGYLGSIGGAIIIYILQTILTALNMQEAGKDIIYGCVILGVLFVYGRAKTVKS